MIAVILQKSFCDLWCGVQVERIKEIPVEVEKIVYVDKIIHQVSLSCPYP